MAELNVPTSSDLRARLREACDSAGAAPTDAWELTEVMLTPEFLGHPDPAIRDELVYVTLCDWILEGALRPEQLRTVLATVTDDEHLFRLLGALDDDAAVLRSFSVLIVPPLLVRHRRSGFFEPAELQALAARLAAYIHGERDLRGYDPRLGWVHAVAHASDAIGSLLRAAELGDDDVHRLLAALRSAAASQHHVYAHGEDERLAGAITIGLGRGTLSATSATTGSPRSRPWCKTARGWGCRTATHGSSTSTMFFVPCTSWSRQRTALGAWRRQDASRSSCPASRSYDPVH